MEQERAMRAKQKAYITTLSGALKVLDTWLAADEVGIEHSKLTCGILFGA